MIDNKYLRAINLCEDKLIDDIIVTDIIPDLRTCSSFTEEDEEYIYHEITSKAKAGKLLNIIREKDNECFEKFRDILSTTNEELAEILENEINADGNITRKRRLSVTECGDILIKGGVPIRTGDYVPRTTLEKKVLHLLKSNSKKPILIYGILGSGKSSIISNLLHNPEIFPDKFLNCCWITIGNISENDVINKLKILLKKLNFNKSVDISMSNIPEIIVEDIKKQLACTNTLLIVHDVYSMEIMKYFTFHQKYIVISCISNLFPPDTAELVHIPEKFSVEECNQLINYHNIQNSIANKIINKSDRHPMFLNWICNLLKSNKDSVRLIDHLNFDDSTISKMCIDILDDSVQNYFIMLMILPLNGTITVELLAIYWDVEIQEAFKNINKLCDNNLMKKEWYPEYNCNMYGVYNFYLNYLKNSKHNIKLKDYQKLLVERFFNEYKTWLDIDIPDPFFFIFYENILYNSKDFAKLTNLYCDYTFIAAKIAVCGISELVYDYQKYHPYELVDEWDEFEMFLRKYSHKFHHLPYNKSTRINIAKIFTTLIQCGLYEMKESSTYKLAFEKRTFSKRNDFWDWINPTRSIKTWENNYRDRIELVDINEYCLLMSTASSQVLLLDLNSGICLFNIQFSQNPIILVKFIKDMEIMIIDSKAQIWLFNPNELISEMNSLTIDNDEEFYDDIDPTSAEMNSYNFILFRNYFQNLLVDDILNKCIQYKVCNKHLNTNNLQATYFGNEIHFFNNHDTKTYVAIYDRKTNLVNDFTIIDSEKIQKYLFNSDELILYSLQYDGKIALYDEFGNFDSFQIIPDEAIVDFIINGKDIFCIAKNKVFKNMEELFSVSLSISKISMSNDRKFLVLCLIDETVQIWDHLKKELIYSLHDSQFNNVYFSNNSNILITTGETNVAKWKIEDLIATTNNNNNSQQISFYRREFIMKKLNSSVVLMLQTIQNDIEFCRYDRDKFTARTIFQSSIASCFSCLNDFVIIGLKSGILEIYNLRTFEKINYDEMKISEFEIKSLATYTMDETNIGIVVLYDNKIAVYSFNSKSFKIVTLDLELPENVQICKFFNHNEDLLILGAYNDNVCKLFKIFKNKVLVFGNYDLGDFIIDSDISGDMQYLCMISTSSNLRIWETNSRNCLISIKENNGILRKCKFRPKCDFNKWQLVAVINDDAEIYLYYFYENEYMVNLIVKESSSVNQIPYTLEWSLDSIHLLVGESDIMKWKIPTEPRNKDRVNLPLTKLQTYFGGIQCIQVQENFIATVDQQGFLYVLKKLN